MPNHSQLIDPQAFHAWLTDQKPSSETVDFVCDLIAHDSSGEASLRCAMLALDYQRWDLANEYLRQARKKGGHEDVGIAANVYECRRELRLARLEDRVSSTDGPANTIGALQEARKRFEQMSNKRDFTLEQEFFCLLAISNVHHKRCEWDKALAVISEALGLAKTLEVPQLISRARSLIVNYLSHSGQIAAAEKANQEVLRESEHNDFLGRHQHIAASIRFLFGSFSEALQIIETAEISNEDKKNLDDFFQLLLGRLHPAYSPHIQQKYEWLGQGFQKLAAIKEMAPITSNEANIVRCANAITQLFQREIEFPGALERCFHTFLKASARLILREYTLAGFILSQYEVPEGEPDISVALVAALRLELCLQIHSLDYFSMQQSLRDLQLIVKSFDRYSFSSSAGLAQFLGYWTPLATAFLSVLPNANPHFVFASKAILKIESSGAFAHAIQIPNKYASEQVLMAHGISLRRNSITVPNLNAREQAQRDALRVMNGEAPYWRPVLSVGPIAYGLMRLARETGNDEYARHACALFQQFELFPKSKTDFAEHLQVAVLDAYNRLFNGFTTLEGFVDEIVRLRL